LYHDKIRYSIQQKVVTKQAKNLVKENPASMKLGTILLSKKIPLLINYFTFSMDSAGEIIFRDDIYELDKYVIDLLNKPVRFTMM
jgi:murein L,D-transpeptidase YcbB/YkuD